MKRRRFSAKVREQLCFLVTLIGGLRSLQEITPYHRQFEVTAVIDLLHEHVNALIDGKCLDHDLSAVEQVRAADCLRRSLLANAAGKWEEE